jgi:hypothetical protein
MDAIIRAIAAHIIRILLASVSTLTFTLALVTGIVSRYRRKQNRTYVYSLFYYKAVTFFFLTMLWILIRMFLGLPDPDPSLFLWIRIFSSTSKKSKENLDFY